MFHYEFMVIAFVVALLLGLCFPLLGGTVVYKRLSSSGDALAHSSLAGVAIGLVAGLNPLYISIASCVVSFLIIGLLRRKFGNHAEVGVTVVLAAGIAISGILSGYSSAANFDSYLFGSILLIGYDELIVVIVMTVIALVFAVITFFWNMHALYSLEEAKIAHIPANTLDLIHSLLFALAIAIGAKIVGSLVVSSMMALPAIAAMALKKGYRFTYLSSVFISLLCMSLGVVLSYYLEWKPGATSVGLAVAVLVLILLYRGILALMKKARLSFAPRS